MLYEAMYIFVPAGIEPQVHTYRTFSTIIFLKCLLLEAVAHDVSSFAGRTRQETDGRALTSTVTILLSVFQLPDSTNNPRKIHRTQRARIWTIIYSARPTSPLWRSLGSIRSLRIPDWFSSGIPNTGGRFPASLRRL